MSASGKFSGKKEEKELNIKEMLLEKNKWLILYFELRSHCDSEDLKKEKLRDHIMEFWTVILKIELKSVMQFWTFEIVINTRSF